MILFWFRNFLEITIKKTQKFIRVNEKIKVSPLLVIDSDGANLGEMDNYKARALADEKNLDLVEINPSNHPPICKIMDFGKYKYDQAQKLKANKAKQRKTELKEVRISPKISDHDLSYKAKRAREFFDKGHNVKISMRLRGRENVFIDNAFTVFEKFSSVSGLKFETRPKKSGSIIIANVSEIIPENNNIEDKENAKN